HQFQQDAVSVTAQTFVERTAGARVTVYIKRIADTYNVETCFSYCLGDCIQSDAVQGGIVSIQIAAVINNTQDATGLECSFYTRQQSLCVGRGSIVYVVEVEVGDSQINRARSHTQLIKG